VSRYSAVRVRSQKAESGSQVSPSGGSKAQTNFPFDICHLPFVIEESQTMANGKYQMENGKWARLLPSAL
jgi:hypothetical protein